MSRLEVNFCPAATNRSVDGEHSSSVCVCVCLFLKLKCCSAIMGEHFLEECLYYTVHLQGMAVLFGSSL